MIAAVAVLVFLVVAIPVLICSAHIPGLRTLTGAAPLQDEEPPVLPPLPLDANPEDHAADVDRHSRTAQQARRATRPSELPHQDNRGRTL